MHEYLIEHAQKNVWCSPGQDRQFILQPKRVTSRYGSLNQVNYLERWLTLPKPKLAYHVFHVGQLDPSYFNLIARTPSWTAEKWYTISEAINTLNVEVTIYTAEGVNLPRYKSYFMYTREKSLVFAVEIDKSFPINWYTDNVYFRFYTNAYFQEGEGSLTENNLVTQGYEPEATTTILYMQTEFAKLKAKKGLARAYCNGLLIEDIDLTTVKIGDKVEWIYDSSVKRVVALEAIGLHSFLSKLDQTYKYLIHHQSLDTTSIDYQDDIDIHILTPEVLGKSEGLYYNRNNPKNHRMVTHRDYSVSVDNFTLIAKRLSEIKNRPDTDLRTYRIQLMIREGGYKRSLIHDHNRIFELYKLPDDEVLRALIGLDATIPEWSCDNLEDSAYTKIMRTAYSDISIKDVEDAYGYNSISTILADTPTKTSLYSWRQRATLPYMLQKNSTVYEFDEAGLLLGWHYHFNDNDYEAWDNSCRLVEAIAGKGTKDVDVSYGQTDIPLPTAYNHRVYLCTLVDGVPDRIWMDITSELGSSYQVVNDRLVWLANTTDHWVMVRTDKTFLAYDLELQSHEGMLMFSVTENLQLGSGQDPEEVLSPVPGGQIDIWINGHSAIQGLDYILQFPVVQILNKTYLNTPCDTAVQKIHVRMCGFCDKQLKLLPLEESGWVAHGALSNNTKFDIRDDRVLRIVVDGKTVHRDSLKFYEDSPSVSVTNVLNGAPYQIKALRSPLGMLISSDTDVLMEKSRLLDKKISDYLSDRIDTSGPPENSAIREPYPLVSPFFSHLIHLLKNKQIPLSPTQALSDMDIIALCKPYESLLRWDPLNEENAPDPRYAYVIPHRSDTVISLGLYQYRFLLRVLKIYAEGKINLSPFINYILEA